MMLGLAARSVGRVARHGDQTYAERVVVAAFAFYLYLTQIIILQNLSQGR